MACFSLSPVEEQRWAVDGPQATARTSVGAWVPLVGCSEALRGRVDHPSPRVRSLGFPLASAHERIEPPSPEFAARVGRRPVRPG
jgi:hypothetical protein